MRVAAALLLITSARGATRRYRAMGVHLDLYDTAGTVLERFEAPAAAD